METQSAVCEVRYLRDKYHWHSDGIDGTEYISGSTKTKLALSFVERTSTAP